MTASPHPLDPQAAVLRPAGARPRIMGILNVTPDSFSDGGRYACVDAALAQARRLEAEGADILDIGAESTRPGAPRVDEETEIARLRPALEAILPEVSIPVSVDTMKASVARMAVDLGARMVNDVWALRHDRRMADVVAESGVELVMMHNREAADPDLDILDDMRRYFDRSLALARDAGVAEDRITLDPGIGFGKTQAQNLTCLRRLDALRALGFPVLLGASRKSSIGRVTGREVGERLAGTLAANAWGLIAGADVVRVHDVKEHADAVKMLEAIRHA